MKLKDSETHHYYSGLEDANELLEILEVVENAKKNPPKSEKGKKGLRFYENKLLKWKINPKFVL